MTGVRVLPALSTLPALPWSHDPLAQLQCGGGEGSCSPSLLAQWASGTGSGGSAEWRAAAAHTTSVIIPANSLNETPRMTSTMTMNPNGGLLRFAQSTSASDLSVTFRRREAAGTVDEWSAEETTEIPADGVLINTAYLADVATLSNENELLPFSAKNTMEGSTDVLLVDVPLLNTLPMVAAREWRPSANPRYVVVIVIINVHDVLDALPLRRFGRSQIGVWDSSSGCRIRLCLVSRVLRPTKSVSHSVCGLSRLVQ